MLDSRLLLCHIIAFCIIAAIIIFLSLTLSDEYGKDTYVILVRFSISRRRDSITRLWYIHGSSYSPHL